MVVDYDAVIVGGSPADRYAAVAAKQLGSHGCPRGTSPGGRGNKAQSALDSHAHALTPKQGKSSNRVTLSTWVFTRRYCTQLQYICGVGRSNAVG